MVSASKDKDGTLVDTFTLDQIDLAIQQPFANYKLGKKAAVHDPRNLKLARYFTPQLPPPPEKIYWHEKISRWPVLGNDRYSDCAIVAHAHQLLMNTFLTSAVGKSYVPTLSEVLKTYSDITGFNLRNGMNDNGTVMLDALKYYRKVGLAGRKIIGYAQVNHLNNETLMQAIYLFGGVYCGVNLPQAAKSMPIWLAPRHAGNRVGPYAPGTWGGHAVCITSYDSERLYCPTWGKLQAMSWLFKEAYMDEAWIIVTDDWLDDVKLVSPSGLDKKMMIYDMQHVGMAA